MELLFIEMGIVVGRAVSEGIRSAIRFEMPTKHPRWWYVRVRNFRGRP